MQKVLLAEDEENLRDTIKLNLELEGYVVIACSNGTEALKESKHHRFDLAILDVMMPEIDGFETCVQLKQQASPPPVLFLTARTDGNSRITGLKLADDYLTKPFNLEELILRVRNLLKRYDTQPTQIIHFDDFEINFTSLYIKTKTETITSLSQREWSLLNLLLNKKNQIVSRDEILEKLWLPTENPSARTIDNYILNFRKIFEKNQREPKYIQSIRGVGYKFSINN
ncbi:MAG: response regulator transcription factor [Bacteroidetes bacterium]|nr:response regulator transcription factor [Bacteroidota bacterium]